MSRDAESKHRGGGAFSHDTDIGKKMSSLADGTVIGMQYIKDNVDVSKVSPQDLSMMNDIILGLLKFDKTMPELRIRVIDTPGEYVIRVEGFNETWGFSIKAWNAAFIDPATRDHKYAFVLDTRVLPYSKSLEITVIRTQDARASHVVRKTKAVQVQRRASPPRKPVPTAAGYRRRPQYRYEGDHGDEYSDGDA
jgi:hypothetical protein